MIEFVDKSNPNEYLQFFYVMPNLISQVWESLFFANINKDVGIFQNTMSGKKKKANLTIKTKLKELFNKSEIILAINY